MFEPPGGNSLDEATAAALLEARHNDPFAVLGPHDTPRGRVVRAVLPDARHVEVLSRSGDFLGTLEQKRHAGLFAGLAVGSEPYVLRIEWPGAIQVTEDPYSFGPVLGDLDLFLLTQGEHRDLAQCLGAHVCETNGISGVRFCVWAPNARRVSVIGDFNTWDRRRHPMRYRHGAGVWEIFVPRLKAGARYKFAILGPDGQDVPDKADPLARQAGPAGEGVSIVAGPMDHAWQDADWMAGRARRQTTDAPLSIYEVHLPSWKHFGGKPCTWRTAIEKLVPYAASLGFTHIELLPVMEHPFRGSWGYQPLSLFAPSSGLGPPEDFAAFVDACHGAEIGVILDWVPAHFPDDPHGLALFDGTNLYEYSDSTMARHPDWNTCIYDYGRREVRNYIMASALYWLKTFHIDGLRVDAVASMLYRDYSRGPGQWTPNIYGGRENFEAISLLQHMNSCIAEECPGAITIAEESTAWPGVTRPCEDGGLGFSYKWNMGWMNDTLHYMARDPVHRRWHHGELTFGLMYAFSENFVLPLSHDEVVHEKCSLAGKMPGDDWRKRANLRAYLAFMWSHPGKKLLFMGGEFGQWREWNHDSELDWNLYGQSEHAALALLVHRLNRLYRDEASLHADNDPASFRWLVVDDEERSVFAYERRTKDRPPIAIVLNMTPMPRYGYRIGVSQPGLWREILNSDAATFGGSNVGNSGSVQSEQVACGGFPQSIELTLPPLGALFLRPGTDAKP
ncbi:MAG: 1,4-alpha-glucan branching protein GlgB [Beijerinckiaceae bacterium]